jgi:inositol hexakisphosphate
MAALLLYVESPFSMFVNLTLLQTDEQAPLPGALSQLLERVTSAYESAGDFIFNCQMGRGRTTTGMVSACLIATAMNLKRDERTSEIEPDSIVGDYDTIDGPSEEEAYLQGNVLSNQTVRIMELTISSGEYKIILRLVGVLSHGKTAKRSTDGAIDLMQDVQNLRKAIYECVIRPLSLLIGAALS